LCHDSGKDYIAIKVSAHHNAISYRGRYYYRSGSTNQELTGYALDELLLGKYGKTWDSVPVPHIKTEDFYNDAFDVFRKKAVSSGRLTAKDVEGGNAELLQALKLTEGDYLLKAAALLFHQDPEKWSIGSYVKIGYFENAADLIYQDEINGPLLMIPDRVMDTIFTKYFKGLIHYEGIQRVDRYPMPREALREAVLNAVVHKDYSTGNPIQIRVYDDKVTIFNSASLPTGITEEDLQRAHKSAPYNPLIANAFFRSGQIEAWGRGIEKIKASCAADGLPEPEFRISTNDFMICFHIRNNNKAIAERAATNGKPIVPSGTINGTINSDENGIRLLKAVADNPAITYDRLAELLGIPRRTVSREMKKLQESGLIEREGARRYGRWIVKVNKN
jgi:ATP-dependent DNA helicase RecG